MPFLDDLGPSLRCIIFLVNLGNWKLFKLVYLGCTNEKQITVVDQACFLKSKTNK